MSEENKIEVTEVKEEAKTCFCQSKSFRNFLVVALGSFVGMFSALSLFAALHKPPMIKPVPYGLKRPCQCQMHHFKGHKGPHGNFYRKMAKKDFQKFERRDFQRPDRGDLGQKPPVRG